jgi:hypothetical protein
MPRAPITRWERSIACVWGAAEASIFFIVPDVWLMALSTRSLGAAWRGVAWCLGGALVGGTLMWWWGTTGPVAARTWLDAVPAISPLMISQVREQMDRHGLAGLFLGPLGGIPYKVYAVEWGARGGNLAALMLVSMPARALRFALSAVAARWVLDRLRPWTEGRRPVELAIVGLLWLGFYAWYFSRFTG